MRREKSRSTIIVLILITFLILLISLIAINRDKIFIFAQREGWFKREISMDVTRVDNAKMFSLDELKNDDRVRIDNSMMLVNTEHMLPVGFVADAVEYKETTVYMSSCMLDAYADLSAAVADKTGKKLYVSSDLRDAEEQAVLYENDPLTATIPGASEHQTGLALDVYVAYYAGDAFVKSASGRFVNSHAHEYGFIIRYPSYGEDVTGIRYEPWHIRYVGQPHASVIYNNHTTLEEYVKGLEIGTWYNAEGYLVSRQMLLDGALALPDEFVSCTISPDNTGFYIVTVKK